MKNNYASIQRHTEFVVDSISPFSVQTKFGCNLTQLRLFIEHCLIQNELAGKSMDHGNASDPCWCAWQHYLSGLNEHYNEHYNGKHTPKLPATPEEEAIDGLASGWNPSFYPSLSLDRLTCFLNPFDLVDGSRVAIHFELKQGQRPKIGPPLSASAVASHFQIPPGNILRLQFYGPSDRRIPILDDEQTKTLVHSALWNNNESVHDRLGMLAPVLLIRWLRDSVLGIPLRDIEAHDGTHKALDLLHEVMTMACPGKQEHAYAVMRAVANNLWPEDAIQWLLDLPQMNRKVIQAAYGNIKEDGLQICPALNNVVSYVL